MIIILEDVENIYIRKASWSKFGQQAGVTFWLYVEALAAATAALGIRIFEHKLGRDWGYLH